jgi:predicted HNH restriction endonuclease
MVSLERQINEAKKCILVCANCHRGIHAGYYKVPDNYESLFDE